MKRLLYTILLLPHICLSQLDSNQMSKRGIQFELNSLASISSSIYQGSNFKMDYLFAINSNHTLGIGINFFHIKRNSRFKQNDYDMNYNFFALVANYQYKLGEKAKLCFNIGMPFLTYFDSDYYYSSSEDRFSRSMWAYSFEVDNIEAKPRTNYWFVLNPSYQINICKGLRLNSGFTFYVGKSYLFTYLNLGLKYQIR